MNKIHEFGSLYGQHSRWGVYDSNGIAPTLPAAMGCGGGILRAWYHLKKKTIFGIIIARKERRIYRMIIGKLNPKSSQRLIVYDKLGISPTLQCAMGTGGGSSAIDYCQ